MEQLRIQKRQKIEKKEEMRRLSQTRVDQSIQQSKKGQQKGAKPAKEKEAVTADSLEQDLNIPPELKEIIEDSDDDMPLRFNDPNDLMEIFTTLEEKNLFLIKRCQDSEQ